MPGQLAQQGAELYAHQPFQINDMVLELRLLKVWNQREDLQVQDRRLEEYRRVV